MAGHGRSGIRAAGPIRTAAFRTSVDSGDAWLQRTDRPDDNVDSGDAWRPAGDRCRIVATDGLRLSALLLQAPVIAGIPALDTTSLHVAAIVARVAAELGDHVARLQGKAGADGTGREV